MHASGNGVSRKIQRPGHVAREVAWFNQPFEHPPMEEPMMHKMSELIHCFQSLIFYKDAETMLTQFDMTPDELALLCVNGWLETSPIVWILDKLNTASNSTVGLCLNSAIISDIQMLGTVRSLASVQKLVLVINVGRNNDGTVFIGGHPNRSGCHWTLTVIDHTDSYLRQHTDSYLRQHTGFYLRQHTDSYLRQHTDSYLRQHTDFYLRQHTDSYLRQHTDFYLRQHTDSYLRQHTDFYLRQHTDSYLRQHTYSYLRQHTDFYLRQHTYS
ncbi:hypothetical protein ACOMHN_010581 [Nucella lapillus]